MILKRAPLLSKLQNLSLIKKYGVDPAWESQERQSFWQFDAFWCCISKWGEKQHWCLWCPWQNSAGESRVFQAPEVPRHHYHIHEKNRRSRGWDLEGVFPQSGKGGCGRHLGKHQQKLPGVLSSLSSKLSRSECSRDPRKHMWWTYPHPGEKKTDFFCI